MATETFKLFGKRSLFFTLGTSRMLSKSFFNFNYLSSPSFLAKKIHFLATSIKQEGTIDINYEQGLVKFTIHLPSRQEKCQFTLKSTTSTIYNLVHDLKLEDKGIDRVVAYNMENERLARSTPLHIVLQKDFYLYINDIKFFCKAPTTEFISKEKLNEISNVKNAISLLYTSLNVEEHQIAQEKALQARLSELKTEIAPLEMAKLNIDKYAHRKTRVLTWLGLAYMGVQFGFLARLTWFEYSWDIMEPVTYFVGYGTAIVCYAYYLLTNQEYILPQVYDREYLKSLHKSAKNKNLNLKKYNELKDAISELDYNLKRIRDPLQLHLPLQCQKL